MADNVKRALQIAKSGRLSELISSTRKTQGKAQGERLARAADLTNLERFNDPALREMLSKGLIAIDKPSKFNELTPPLDADDFGPYRNWYNVPDWEKQVEKYGPKRSGYLQYLKDRGPLSDVPQLRLTGPHVIPERATPADIKRMKKNPAYKMPRVFAHDGRHRALALGDEPTMPISVRPLQGSTIENLPPSAMIPKMLTLAGRNKDNTLWTRQHFGAEPEYVEPPEELFAKGGTVHHDVGSPERAQAFEQWGGTPERWYHGTSKDVDFSKFKIGRHGAWFARDPKVASMYAEQNDSQGYKRDGWNVVKTNTRSRVIPVHLKLGKSHTGPLPDSFKTENYKKAQSEWFDQLRAQGYDSWVPEGGDVAVVLKDPTQIKSAIGNRGTFDPNEADISKAEGGEVDERRARGAAMGFDMDTPLYHGTNKDIQAFEPRRASRRESMALKGTHLADNPEFANQYAQGKGANVMPVRARGKFLDAGKLVYEGSPEHEILNQLVKQRPNLRVFWDKDHEGKRVAPPLVSYLDAVPPAAAERIVGAAGYDGVRYPARYGDSSGRVSARTNATLVFDPKNIRSQFAAYDPEHSDSADLMKAEGGAVDTQEITSADTSIKQVPRAYGGTTKEVRRALMIARDQRNLLRRIANIYPGPGGGMDPSPGGGGYAGPGGGRYPGPSRYSDGGGIDRNANLAKFLKDSVVPHRVYHGTSDDIRYFSTTHPNRKDAGWLGEGVYLTASPVVASNYATQKRGAAAPNVMPLHIRLTKPYKATTEDKRRLMMIEHTHGREAAQQASADWSNALKSKGHDGVIYEGPIKGMTEYVVFDPANVKSASGNQGTFDTYSDDITRASGGKVPPFKLQSGAAKIIKSKGQAKATPQQYAAMPGIKPDELKHAKFDELGNKALPKEQVLEHLEANKVPLQETVLTDQRGPTGQPYDTEKTVKFNRPDLVLPGGKNYREVLLHLPPTAHVPSPELSKARERAEAATRAFDDALADQLSGTPRLSDDEYRRASAEADEARIALSRLERASKDEAQRAGFRGGHWDEPNVLAHLRMSDRRGPNGEKVLHVEEVQSDWGQAGREHGFGAPEIRHAGDRWTAHDPAGNVIAQGRLEDFRDDQHIMENVAPGRTIPSGPYVDNTQKWTDLALKRVLHEAAHGGYDKVVFTPGAEQNKRYSLSKHVKMIDVIPRTDARTGEKTRAVHLNMHDGSRMVLGVDNAGRIDNTDKEAGDFAGKTLSEVVGKEMADRIMSKPDHQLEGQDLEVGGQGMRGYYDNIMPKRLQALAQQHDPKAKVQLGGHKLRIATEGLLRQRIRDAGYEPDEADVQTMLADNGGRRPSNMTDADLDAMERGEHLDYSNPTDTPLHSLDVTPQMRDSIKQNGFNQFKRGGAVDENEGPIADWHWRPLEDVRNELQLDEIPSHVHKFGEFMDETARRAMLHGLTPRDLIKAYAITRSSVGRGALPASTIRRPKTYPKYGFDELPADLQGPVRPEGAMGHWLHTKMGQRYLDAAEAGRVDEEAVQHAIKSMGAFGLPERAEGAALRWAPKNLPGREGRISELVARAYRGQSTPQEWRDEVNMPGIGPAKSGFISALIGRGDAPTFDARQIVLHTGLPTKVAAKRMSRKGQPEAAVSRLINRQNAMDVRHDPSMSPFYQHLLHHAVWDKTSGEETTHQDVIDAMRGAKDGGRQGFSRGGKGAKEKPLSLIEGHPVLHPVQNALLHGLPAEAELQGLLRKAGIVRPYNQASQADVEKALKIAQTYAMPLGTGSGADPSAYYGVKQPLAARDVTTKATATKGFSLKPEKQMSWKEFGDIGKGGHIVNLSGDRTRFGTLHEINGKPLNWPVKVYAGPDYIREPVKGRAWASGPGVIAGLNRTVTELSKKGPVFGMYSPYGGTGGDFAHHMFDAVMAQVDPSQISKATKEKFDAAMRSASFIMGNTEKDKNKRERVKPRMEEWPGIDNPKAASEFARKKLSGDHRKAILEMLDKKMWTDEGFPHVGMTRVAVTDPKLLGVPQNVIGGNVALLKPSDKPMSSSHPSYGSGQPGEYVGTLPFAPRHYALPVSTAHFVKTPSAGKGVHVDPYSLNDKARGGYRTLFERNYVPEPVSSQMVEGAEEGIKKMPLYGLKTGGRIGKAEGGGIDQLLQNLKGSFGQLNQQVAARPSPQAPANYQAMLGQAAQPSLSPDYQAMVENALKPSGKTYGEMFPANVKPYTPAASALTPIATSQPSYGDAAATDYSSWMTQIMGDGGSGAGTGDGAAGGGSSGGAAGADGAGGDGGASSAGGGSAYRYGGQTSRRLNIVERALAVTRRK